MEHYWIAVVFCQGEKRILASFLGLRAWNRRKALKKLRVELAYNPEYLDSDGGLKPFHILELKSIHPSEETFYREAFVEMIQSMFPGQHPAETALSA